MQILAISGSLRAQSTNSTLLKAAASLAPKGTEVIFYEGLAKLPHFNPDLDTETPPTEVTNFRELLKKSKALLVCSPEYIHGVPGSLKNAFDWIASSGELDGMPVGLINASPSMNGATFAQESLKEILTVLSQKVIPEATVSVTAVKTKLSPEGKVTDEKLLNDLRKAIEALIANVR
jgi:NAD(P)H-dependent FMN reductase